MKTQDVIMNKEKLVKTIYDVKSTKCLQDDKNCELLLNFLLAGPLTFEDIKNAFREVNAEKSDKTIYGYLNKLKKANLVMEAGKRIITYSESHIKTLSLYSRTAKVFYIALDIDTKKKDEEEEYYLIIGKILCQMQNYSSFDEKCFKKVFEVFTQKKRIDVEKINKIDNPEILDLLTSIDIRATKYIIDTLCWLSFIHEHPKIHDDFKECFSK
ncbi:MAG: hypothetical protein HZR80_11710 [Candidatus Heimdallarchaeota archaeon]